MCRLTNPINYADATVERKCINEKHGQLGNAIAS